MGWLGYMPLNRWAYSRLAVRRSLRPRSVKNTLPDSSRSALLMVDARVQPADGARHLIAHRPENYTALMGELRV